MRIGATGPPARPPSMLAHVRRTSGTNHPHPPGSRKVRVPEPAERALSPPPLRFTGGGAIFVRSRAGPTSASAHPDPPISSTSPTPVTTTSDLTQRRPASPPRRSGAPAPDLPAPQRGGRRRSSSAHHSPKHRTASRTTSTARRYLTADDRPRYPATKPTPPTHGDSTPHPAPRTPHPAPRTPHPDPRKQHSRRKRALLTILCAGATPPATALSAWRRSARAAARRPRACS